MRAQPYASDLRAATLAEVGGPRSPYELLRGAGCGQLKPVLPPFDGDDPQCDSERRSVQLLCELCDDYQAVGEPVAPE